MKHSKLKLNNKGMSLIELIIIITIMVILTGVSGIGLSIISGKPAQSCSNKFASKLDRIRTVGMGKNSAEAILSFSSDGIHVTETINGAPGESTFGAGLNVAVTMTIGANTQTFGSSDKVAVSFNRTDGSLKSVKVNGVEAYDPASKPSVVLFSFTKASYIYDVKIVPVTGRVVCERR